MAIDTKALDSLRIQRDAGPREYEGRERRWLYAAGAGALALAGAIAWMLLGEPPPEVATARVEAAAATGASAVLDASGYVVARRLATVSSEVTGRLVEVLVEEGMEVREGQVLARLDARTAKARAALARQQLAAAERDLAEVSVRLAEARRNLDRTEKLRAQNLVSETDVDAARAEAAALAARLEALEAQRDVAASAVEVQRRELELLEIRAPFDGVVISKDAQPGEMVSPVSAGGGFTRTGIATIVDMDSREIEVDVNEAFINRVRAGQRAEAILDAYPDWVLPVRVINIVPTADRQKATVRVRIAFEQLDPRILPDMGVKVTFLEEDDGAGAEPAQVAASLPAAAVRTVDGRSYVWVVQGEKVERRAISTGAERNGRVDVRSGVRPGEVVVSPVPEGLEDGARVRIRSAS